MKCASLWQPWATLVEIEAKRFETRSWSTSYRGTLAIHASKKWNGQLAAIAISEPFLAKLSKVCSSPNPAAQIYGGRAFPFGAILCVVDLVDCIQIRAVNIPDYPERHFGDYTPGRFMWKLENVRRLREPLPWVGRQGLFTVPDGVILPRLERAA